MRRRKDAKFVFVWSAAVVIFLGQYAWQFMSIPKVVATSQAAIARQTGFLKVVGLAMIDGVLVAKIRRGLSSESKTVVVVNENDTAIGASEQAPVQVAQLPRPINVPVYGLRP
jgi:hypothetical protein